MRRLATGSCTGFLVKEEKMINKVSRVMGIKQTKGRAGLMRMYLPWTRSVGREQSCQCLLQLSSLRLTGEWRLLLHLCYAEM